MGSADLLHTVTTIATLLCSAASLEFQAPSKTLVELEKEVSMIGAKNPSRRLIAAATSPGTALFYFRFKPRPARDGGHKPMIRAASGQALPLSISLNATRSVFLFCRGKLVYAQRINGSIAATKRY